MQRDGSAVVIPVAVGLSAIVDARDANRVSGIKWCSWTNGRNTYAKNARLGRMHRFLMNAPRGVQVDHINGNGLDNRRENLRFCDDSQNQANRQKLALRYGFRGVTLRKNRFVAQIKVSYRNYWLGAFETAEEAALAYDAAAKRLFGEFGYQNFPQKVVVLNHA